MGECVRRTAGSGDAREGVESSLGRYAFDAGELVEAGYDQVPARPELGEHAPHCVLLTLERREAGALAQDSSEPGDVIGREHAARRVGRGVEDHQPGAFAEARTELVEVEAEPVLLAQRYEDGSPADEVHHRLVDRERRVGQKHLVTLLHERQDGEEHYRLSARRDYYLFGTDIYTPATRHINGDSLAQLWNTGGGCVVGVPVAQSFATGLDDMLRRIEVGFADLEVDDLTALRLQGFRFRQDRKSRLRSQTLHPPRQIHTVLRSIVSRQAPALHHRRRSMNV